MGHEYKGGSETFHSIGANLSNLKEHYPYKDGYFGSPGSSSDSKVRHIESDDPLSTARDFYDRAAYGGIETKLAEGKWKASMEDGTVFTTREVSNSDGTPAVDINIRHSSDSGGVKRQKIHFTGKKGNN